MTTIEEALRKTTDHIEIANLIARVAHVADDGSLDDYGSVYTEDATWDFAAAEGSVNVPTKSLHGLAEIVEGIRARRASGGIGPGTPSRHIVSTTAISILGPNSATALSYWQFIETLPTPTVRTIGSYDDTLRRESSGWRIARRQFTFG